MKDKIPSLIELEAQCIVQIENALSDGSIDAACMVAEALGEDMDDVGIHTGVFKSWKREGITLDFYKTTKSFSPTIQRFLTRVVIRISKHSKEFAYVVLDESRNSLGKDEYVVPGEWQDVVWKYLAHVQKEEEVDQEEQELKRRLYLANLLHFT